MSQTIDAVPAGITMTQVRDLVLSLGINPDDILRDYPLTITGQAVTATVLARDTDGEYYDVNGEIATHTISIPVTKD